MKKVVVVGRSNVGKSSVLRLLTGKKVRVGKRPGVTLKPEFIPYKGLLLVDMPGFGFMEGVSTEKQERIKDFIVHYIEKEDIAFAIEIIDAKAFLEIAERWDARGQIPVDIEMFAFLNELELNPILVANKIDKVEKRDKTLDEICQALGLQPPWWRWRDMIVPFSAKTGEGLQILKKLLDERKRNIY